MLPIYFFSKGDEEKLLIWKGRYFNRFQPKFDNKIQRPLFAPLFGPKPDPIEKETLKNRHFLEIFGIFDTLPHTVFKPNFKRR